MFQRQLSKEGLSNVVNQSGKSAASLMSREDLEDLFTPEFGSMSSTYESMVEAAGRASKSQKAEEAAEALVGLEHDEDDKASSEASPSGKGTGGEAAPDLTQPVHRDQACLLVLMLLESDRCMPPASMKITQLPAPCMRVLLCPGAHQHC